MTPPLNTATDFTDPEGFPGRNWRARVTDLVGMDFVCRLPRCRFWVIRHGETDYNREGRTQGHRDIALNNKGLAQAHAAAEFAATLSARSIVSSDLSRAFETATILSEVSGLTPVTTHKGLRERAYGVLEGEPRSANRWNEDPAGGEAFANFVHRVGTALTEVIAPDRIIVAHGGVLEVTVAALQLPRPESLAANATLNELHID